MPAPCISILIAAYNPRYLRAALRSVAAQTRSDVEIIVRDDSRGGEVRAVVDAFAAHCPLPLDYRHNEAQLGVRRNYERCFADCRGDYIKFLNDDDLLDATCLERLARALDDNPTVLLATSHRRRIDERDSPLRDSPATTPVLARDALIAGDDIVNALLLLGMNFVGEPSTAMFRRSGIADGAPLFDFLGDPGRGVADVVLWCRLAQQAPVAFLAPRLSSFRVHPEQRQGVSDVRTMGTQSIQSMRAKWLALNRHLQVPPNLLRTQALPTAGANVTDDWEYVAIPAFAQAGSDLQQQVDDWRARRHPFFAAGG